MKFTKEIVKPGKFVVNVPTLQADGTTKMIRKEQMITQDRIKHWVDNFAAMKKDGLLVPAPFRHDLSSLPLTAEQRTELETKQKEAGSLTNAGYWEHLFYDEKGTLHGIIDVEVPELAERIGKSFKECSLLALPDFTDGKGKKWEDSLLHVALVTNPIMPGQENFQPLTPVESNEHALALAMSQYIPEPPPVVKPACPLLKQDGTAMSVGDVVTMLAQLGLTLPQDTTEENLMDRLLTAGTAIVATKQGANGNPMGAGLTIIPGGLQMSHKIDPATPQGKMVAKQQREKLTQRIQDLVNSGRVSVDYVKNTLLPQIEGCALSLEITDDGELGPTSLDPVLVALERLPALNAANGKQVKDGTDITKVGALALALGDAPPDSVEEITEEGSKKFADAFFTNIGMPQYVSK